MGQDNGHVGTDLLSGSYLYWAPDILKVDEELHK